MTHSLYVYVNTFGSFLPSYSFIFVGFICVNLLLLSHIMDCIEWNTYNIRVVLGNLNVSDTLISCNADSPHAHTQTSWKYVSSCNMYRYSYNAFMWQKINLFASCCFCLYLKNKKLDIWYHHLQLICRLHFELKMKNEHLREADWTIRFKGLLKYF